MGLYGILKDRDLTNSSIDKTETSNYEKKRGDLSFENND